MMNNLTGYQVLGIVYLDQLSGARNTHISYHDKIICNLDWYLDPYCTCLTWLLQKFLLKIFVHLQHESNPADFAAGGSVGISDGGNSTEKAAELCSACELSPRFVFYKLYFFRRKQILTNQGPVSIFMSDTNSESWHPSSNTRQDSNYFFHSTT